MTESTERPDEPEPDDQRDAREERMRDVDHTHPDTDESFTETGVYERGKKHAGDGDG